jgi:DNA-binding transcriptional MerR regulator
MPPELIPMPRKIAASRKPAAGQTRSTGQRTLVSRTVLCTITGVSDRQLSLWEREELIAPAELEERAGRRAPLYDSATLRRVRLIRTLAEELDVNLPGIDVILHLLDQFSR